MRPHERLEVWGKAIDFVIQIYKHTDHFPQKEKFGLNSQIRRAAVSVPANIAEGAARQSDKEFIHFLSISQGSASELDTELHISHRLGYLDRDSFLKLQAELELIGRFISGLSQHLKRRIN